MIYKTPDQFFFRIHHIRPRFKNDVENVLFFISNSISKNGSLPSAELKDILNSSIRLYPGNATIKQKTVDNWRTEISALFGLIQEDSISKVSRPSTMAKTLASEQDLVSFFKYFLFYFQYPGGHLKGSKNLDLVKAKIKFKPAQYLLRLLRDGENSTGHRFGVNKAEITHCVFNDLRVTRDAIETKEVIDLIIHNRLIEAEYEWEGDVIRYAGDILDYMVIADLLVKYPNGYFYINWKEREAITAFTESEVWFDEYYTSFDGNRLNNLKVVEDNWFDFVNQKIHGDLFKTDVLKYLEIEDGSYEGIINSAIEAFEVDDNDFDFESLTKTKDIGDLGENLIIGHESMRLKLGGKESLIHLIKKIPTYLAIGYDVASLELDEIKRLIEVKTTISNKPLSFYSFHLTSNEWNAAQSYGKLYFIYRLMISKNSKKLFIINDPISRYKEDKIKMTPRDGAQINFTEQSGTWEELLIWEK